MYPLWVSIYAISANFGDLDGIETEQCLLLLEHKHLIKSKHKQLIKSKEDLAFNKGIHGVSTKFFIAKSPAEIVKDD